MKRDFKPSGDWHNRILILWEEDDGRPPDRELPLSALRRISGSEFLVEKDRYDGGDHFWYLYTNGWVVGSFPEGGVVGVVYEHH